MQRHPPPAALLILSHLLAGGAMFAVLTVVPTVAVLLVIVIDGDPGGPMFLPIFVMGLALVAAMLAGGVAAVSLTRDLLRQRWRVPLWVAALVVAAMAAGGAWLLAGAVHPAAAPVAAVVGLTVFAVHAATAWSVSRIVLALGRTVT